MSLLISFDDYLKILDKECFKQTGLTLIDFPNIFPEDYWPANLDSNLSIQTTKEAVENCIEHILSTLSL